MRVYIYVQEGIECVWFMNDWLGFHALSISKAIIRARTYSHTLFSPVMMITWGTKLVGSLPPGHDVLLFSTSGTGSFIYPVAQTQLDIQWHLIIPSHGPLVGMPRWAISGGGKLEPTTGRSTVDHAYHQTTRTPVGLCGSEGRRHARL